jgi:thiol-disulfide isomerase/thioredoxin
LEIPYMPLRPLLSGLLALAATSGIPRVGENEQAVETKKPGSEAPPFELETLDAKKVTSAELLGDAKERTVLVLVFWSRQCPWVERWNPDLEALVQEFKKQPRVRFAVVDSDKNETGDAAAIRDYLAKAKYTFPVYLDRGNAVADRFGASTTPHCFVIGKERKLVYTGRINDRRPPDAVAGAKPAAPPPPPDPLLRKAILAALEGKAPDVPVDAPTGCRIKRQ